MTTEKQLISLDEALEATHKEVYWTKSEAAYIRSFLVKLPRADAVEVVRCKDCRYRIHDEVTNEWFCNSSHSGFVYAKPNDFCSYGERRTDE